MANTYKTPGVYIQEISQVLPSVAEFETAIPAFIGYTEKALVNGIDQSESLSTDGPVVRRITSLLEYEQMFGGPLPEIDISASVNVDANGDVKVTAEIGAPSPFNMYYSLQGYFANGGGPCYIASVGKASRNLPEKDALEAGLKAIAKEDEVTLIVFPEILSLEIGDSSALYNAALQQCNELQNRFVVMDVAFDTPGTDIFKAAENFRSRAVGNNYLKYGAAYGPKLETVFNYAYNEANVKVNLTIPAGAESQPPRATSTTLAAINPAKTEGAENGQFYPLIKRAVDAIPLVLPAAPLVVGVYAAVDRTRGVWKAPANVRLSSVIGPTVNISQKEQENLNIDSSGKSINAIRAFPGKGTLIWGARTLAGNDNEWRYVPVRRFFNMAEESIKKGTEGFVFEPNDANTWAKVRFMVGNFLLLQWRAGALQGAKPEQAFYVKIGLNETMTPLDILEGRMIIEIGMAVVRPAEFIILRFSHKMVES